MATINKNLEKLTKVDVERISNEYLLGWHNLSKNYGFLLKGLNKKRVEYGLDAISKDMSHTYRLNYIRRNYTTDTIESLLFEYMSETKMDEARWSGIALFGCNFGREFAKFFRELLGRDVYNDLAETARVYKLTKTQKSLYGGVGLAGDSTMKKAQETLLQNLGVTNPMYNDNVKDKLAETNNKLYGGNSPFSSRDVQEKSLMTKLKKVADVMVEYRLTGEMDESIFSQSPNERIVFNELVDRFGKGDVYYEYGIYPYDERYPYTCDFYIKSLDLFIEIHHHYTHGGEWYSDENEHHQQILQDLNSTSTTYSDRYIRTWTERDVAKRNQARDGNLNYLVFWDNTYSQENHVRTPRLADFYEWLNDYDCDIANFIKDNPKNTY